jgi:hypothetical protein
VFQQIITPRAAPVITPETLCSFARIDVPQSSPPSDDYLLLGTFIEAATDEIENMAATACAPEEIFLTFDMFPNEIDPRVYYDYLLYSFDWIPAWWHGWVTKESLCPVRTPILLAGAGSPPNELITDPVLTYNDCDGNPQTFDSSNYQVVANKLTLNVGCCWPPTDRRQDCIQLTYWAGHQNVVPARLQLAIMFLAAHFWENRSIIAIEPTSEVGLTLSRMLSSYRSYRIAT